MKKLKLKARKVAFTGSSTSSRSLAPFDDPEWEIWATGPGKHTNPGFADEFDRWFEIHDMVDNDPKYHNVIDVGYFEWLVELGKKKPIHFKPPLYEGLTGEVLPWDEILAEHGGFFLDSTIAWMMAFLYECGDVDEIGLWGIDFATDAERIKQRKGTKHFQRLFEMKGVPCQIPAESEMIFDPLPYPEVTDMEKKINAQLDQISQGGMKNDKLLEQLRAQVEHGELHAERIRGMMEALMHIKENWT
jgi:hypothetical protein